MQEFMRLLNERNIVFHFEDNRIMYVYLCFAMSCFLSDLCVAGVSPILSTYAAST